MASFEEKRESVLKHYIDPEMRMFAAGVIDRITAADRRGFSNTDFMDLKQSEAAYSIVRAFGCDNFLLNGGFKNAERKMLFIFNADMGFSKDSFEAWGYDTTSDIIYDSIRCIRVKNRGANSLTHRDYLGAVLGLGIKRDRVGDIITDESGAYIAISKEIIAFLLQNLEKVGANSVKLKEFENAGEIKRVDNVFESVFTVASLRLDALVSKLINKSREKAADIIEAGMVSVNHTVILKTDFKPEAGAIVSIRGYGRFLLSAVDGVTKSGRLKIKTAKYL